MHPALRGDLRWRGEWKSFHRQGCGLQLSSDPSRPCQGQTLVKLTNFTSTCPPPKAGRALPHHLFPRDGGRCLQPTPCGYNKRCKGPILFPACFLVFPDFNSGPRCQNLRSAIKVHGVERQWYRVAHSHIDIQVDTVLPVQDGDVRSELGDRALPHLPLGDVRDTACGQTPA